MLGDFDNSADLNSRQDTADLKAHTVRFREICATKNNLLQGTPNYIARAVSKGVPGKIDSIQPMPDLVEGSDAYNAYVAVRGDDELPAYEYSVETVGIENEVRKEPTEHCARHDAESVYWVLVDFLLHAVPQDVSEVDHTFTQFCQIWEKMTHIIGAPVDSRNLVMDHLREPTSCLHPSLLGVGPFIRNMTLIVQPEYHWLKAKPNQFHLHEAMQRLLLQEILRIKATTAGDTYLDTIGRKFKKMVVLANGIVSFGGTFTSIDSVNTSAQGSKRASEGQGSRSSRNKRSKTAE